MAHVMGITLPAGWDIIYNKTLKMYDISVLCNVGKNPIWFPRSKFVTLKEVTYFFSIAYAWGLFTQAQKDDWTDAADIIGQHNYNLYVQDKAYRIKNAIGGNSTPSIYHQYFVGNINIAGAATSAKILQYNFKKILFPASFGISYHTNLTAAGADPYARFKFIWNLYKTGETIEEVETIEIPLISGWDKQTVSITQVVGRAGKWRVELELNDVTGDLWFDNPFVLYNGQIQLNDPFCLDVVKWWKGENIPAGVTFTTVYPVGGAL